MSHDDNSDDDILSLSESPATPAESEKPKENRHILISKVGAVLLSAGFIAVVGFVVGAFQLAGVTSVGLAHVLIAIAWAIATFAVSLWLLSRPRKHTLTLILLTVCGFALVFFLADRAMMWQKAEQERAAAKQSSQSFMPPSPTMPPSPVNTQKAFSLNGHIEKVIIDGQSEAKETLLFVFLSVGNDGERPSVAKNYKLRIETNSFQYSGDAQDIDKEYSLTDTTEKTAIHPEESLIKKTKSPIPVGEPVNGWLRFIVPNVEPDSIRQLDMKVKVSFSDISNNSYSAERHQPGTAK